MGGWGNFQDEHEPGTVGMEEAIGVKIEFQKYPTDADFWNNLPAQIAAKTAPDFISLTNELYLPYINDGLVVPLTSYVEDGTISCWDSIAQNLKDIWEIDGLGRFGTYVRIVLPISGVLIATIAIFNFTGTWNSYLVPSTFISTLEKFVLVVGLQTVNNEHFQQENLTLAGVFLLSFPVIIFFMFTQKFFVQGIATSGIKS